MGLTVIFALTGKHPTSLPKNHEQRRRVLKEIVAGLESKVGEELRRILEGLVEADALRRGTNYQLRRILKEKEREIIHGG